MTHRITIVEAINYVLSSLNEKRITVISDSNTRQRQILEGLNWARNRINQRACFPWDEYWGTIITVTGKTSYPITQQGNKNYLIYPRYADGLTNTNCTIAMHNRASFDDTYNLAKVTATGASPSLQQVTTTISNWDETSHRISGSVWIAFDTDDDPGTVTLKLLDNSGTLITSEEITNDGSLQRYGVSGLHTGSGSTTTARLRIEWTSATGVIYVDGWQVEVNDYPSELIEKEINADGWPYSRWKFADPDRIHSIAPYKYNTRLSWNEIGYYDRALQPNDHTTPALSLYRYYSSNGHFLNLENFPAGTHLIYRGKRVPTRYNVETLNGTAIDATYLDVPLPWAYTVLQGVTAWIKEAGYDIRANNDVKRAQDAFDNAVEEMIMLSSPNPAWSFVDVASPVMMV